MKEMYDFIICDGLNMCHKFLWKLNHLHDKKGRSTGMLYGIIDFIRCHRRDYPKTKIIFVWDSPSLKKKISYSAYKSDRSKKPDSFYEQVNELKKMLSLYNVIQYVSFGIEADDLAKRLVNKHEGKNILLYSSDADWYMFVSDNVDIYNKGKILKKEDVLKIIGLKEIALYADYLSIVGTHNFVKGVPRIRKQDILDILNCVERSDNKIEKTKQMIKDNLDLIKSNREIINPITKGYKLQELPREDNKGELCNMLKSYNMTGLWMRIVEDNILENF